MSVSKLMFSSTHHAQLQQLMFNSTHHARLQHCMAYRCSTALSLRELQV